MSLASHEQPLGVHTLQPAFTMPLSSNEESGGASSDTDSISSSSSSSSSSLLDDDEERAGFDYDAQSSAFTQFTSPSSLGSALAALQSGSGGSGSNGRAAAARSVGGVRDGSEEDQSPLRQRMRAAHELSLTLTREALLLDLEQGTESPLANHSSTAKGKSSPASSPWPRLKQVPEPTRVYVCAKCGTSLALQDELISKAFSGRDGKAYLFFSVFNTEKGPKEDRQLLTGLHTVADLTCAGCKRSVGWYYLRAYQAAQRYKEGKFILERAALHKINNWSL